jgi:drug/metabolite transporter (DMT)-like permease
MSAYSSRKKTYALLASMVFFSSLGNVLLSRGMKQIGEIVDFSPGGLVAVFIKTFTNGSIWLGMSSLLVFFVSYLLMLSWADFSYVQPASAIGYALVAVLGYFMLGEFVSPVRWAGVLLISAGVALVSGTEPASSPQLRRGEPRSSLGWGGVVQENHSFDQHHPGASRHPSSSEEGS